MALVKVDDKKLSVVSDTTSKIDNTQVNKKILDEEKYTKDLEKIIVRDFYPDLPKLQVQNQYLNAIKKNDTETIRRLHHKYGPKRIGLLRPTSAVTTPSTFETPIGAAKDTPSTFETPIGALNDTPSTFDTPLIDSQTSNITRNVDKEEEGPSRNPEPHEVKDKKTDSDLRLDAYLSKNTSEDNAAFDEIIKEAEKKDRFKHAWLYEQEETQNQERDRYLSLPGIDQQAITSGNPTKLDTWIYKPKNALMYVPEGSDLSAKEQIELQGKKAREIIHSSTRFQTNPFNLEKNKETIHEAASAQAVINSGKIGVDGKEVLPAETPKVNGYSFMATPSPAPGVEDSPLMTWGEIDGTPFRLDATDTPLVHKSSGPTFKIPDVPKRDQIGFDLAEKASKAHRAKKEQALKQAAATFSVQSPSLSRSSRTERLQNMSPAAQRLASSRLCIRTSTDKALRASYSPSPGSSLRRQDTPLGIKTPTPGSSRRRGQLGVKTPTTGEKRTSAILSKTPTLELHGSESSIVDDAVSLTDNLLNLPKKRPKAGDFF